MTSKFGLGRGLSALIPGASAPTGSAEAGRGTTLAVPTDQIHPNPQQPRRTFDAEELAQLVASIREHGILQPLVVTRRVDGSYELIVGERRLRAAKLAGLPTVPVIIRDGTSDDREKLELALIENIQRADLNAIERALAYRELLDRFGFTHEEVAARVGISRSSVSHTLRFLRLPTDMQDALRGGAISEGHAKYLVGIADAAEQRAWFERVLQGHIPVAVIAANHPVVRQAPSRARTGASGTADPNLRARAMELQRALGAKVAITARGRGGTITIAYADPEELSGIVRAITRRG